MPERIQLSRAKGWRKPPNTVAVARPGRWGNPFRGPDAADQFRRWLGGRMSAAEFVAHADSERWRFADDATIRAEAVQLRGKNLACWCRLDQPCHADALLEVANG